MLDRVVLFALAHRRRRARRRGHRGGPGRRPGADRRHRRRGRRHVHPGAAGDRPDRAGPGGGQPVPADRHPAQHGLGADRHPHGIRGYSSAVGTACASGAQAVAEAARLIPAGKADVVLCGASEAPLFPTFADTFGNARALARGWADPTKASRPFDRRRNGFVLGRGGRPAGAGTGRARRRPGRPDVRGGGRLGQTTDAHHPTMPRPDGEGAADCMRQALADGRRPAGRVGYVNAHGTGTKSVTSPRHRAWERSSGSAGCRSAPPRRSPGTCSARPGWWRRRPGALALRARSAAADVPPGRSGPGVRPRPHPDEPRVARADPRSPTPSDSAGRT